MGSRPRRKKTRTQTGTGMEKTPYQGGTCRTCQVPRSPAFPSPHPVKAPESGQASGRCSLLSGPADRQGSPNLRGRDRQCHRKQSGGRVAGDTLFSRQAHPLHSSNPEPGRVTSSSQSFGTCPVLERDLSSSRSWAHQGMVTPGVQHKCPPLRGHPSHFSTSLCSNSSLRVLRPLPPPSVHFLLSREETSEVWQVGGHTTQTCPV